MDFPLNLVWVTQPAKTIATWEHLSSGALLLRKLQVTAIMCLHQALFLPAIARLQAELSRVQSQACACMGSPRPPLDTGSLDRLERAVSAILQAPNEVTRTPASALLEPTFVCVRCL